MNRGQRDPKSAWRRHDRQWAGNRYVYPVVSRRSRGLSIGINLNPDKGCNFDCVYCQVDRRTPPAVRRVDLAQVARELDGMIAAARDGTLFDAPPCSVLPPDQRVVRDIAFSGDGEPTTYPRFREAVEVAAEARRRHGLDETKLVLITDAAYLSRPAVREALAVLDANNGEIWAKLDAGTEEYYRRVNRPNVPLAQVLAAILEAARARPIVIQTLFCRLDGAPPPPEEIEAYAARLRTIVEGGGRITNVQLHTIARPPAESSASPLTDAEIDAVAGRLRSLVPIPVSVFYGLPATSTDGAE